MSNADIIIPLIKNKMQKRLGVEVGVASGNTTERLLHRFKRLRIIGVDPYEYYEHYAKYHSLGENNSQDKLNLLWYKTTRRLKKRFEDRFMMIRKRSVEAARNVEDESCDFVFLDSNYGFKYACEDIGVWYPKIRVGGIVIGQNFDSNKDSKDCIKRAVYEHFKPEDVKLSGRRWYVIKTSTVGFV